MGSPEFSVEHVKGQADEDSETPAHLDLPCGRRGVPGE
jgi:hypothetical protein